jgi:fatty-acyl-CoA synthase
MNLSNPYAGERRPGTVGFPLPGVSACILDPDGRVIPDGETGEDCAPGVPGELLCRGYNIMKGYYKMPEATEKAIDAAGGLHSGDLGTVDEDGYYRITGRIKDVIIRGGENIYPREIEEFLYTMPGVKDVQIVGVPDAKYGEVVGAFIQRFAGSDITEGDVQEYTRARLARYKAPKYVFFVDSYPMTASGKIQKYKLRDMAKEQLGIDVGVYSGEEA